MVHLRVELKVNPQKSIVGRGFSRDIQDPKK
jgi:hypothetical protein